MLVIAQVPFPRMHFLLSSLAPLAAPRDVAALSAPRSIDQVGSYAGYRPTACCCCLLVMTDVLQAALQGQRWRVCPQPMLATHTSHRHVHMLLMGHKPTRFCTHPPCCGALLFLRLWVWCCSCSAMPSLATASC